jgi:hypothetical protein
MHISGTTWVCGQGINFMLVTGTLSNDDAKCVIQTLDSGYALIGTTSGFGNGQSDIYLTKISKTGQVTWQQAIGGAGIEKGNSLIQTADSGYALAGYSNSSGSGGYDVYLAKTDKNGLLQWSNTYGGFDWDFGNYLIQTTGGDYVICGSTYSYGHGDEDAYLLKTDSSGILLWDSAYGGSQEETGSSVCETSDGGYFMTGNTKSFGQGKTDVYLLKTDQNGNAEWEKAYGDTAEDIGSDGKQTPDGGFIIAASTKRFYWGMRYQNWFIKTDALGDTLWSRRDTAVFDRTVNSVCIKRQDSGFVFTGQNDPGGEYAVFMYTTDKDGYYQNFRGYGGPAPENAFSIRQTFDNGYVVAAITQSFGVGLPNIYVIKTDSDLLPNTGNPTIVVGTQEINMPRKNISLYPNPASGYFILNAEKNSVLEIFDPLGRMVGANLISRGKNTVDIAGLPDGIYFIQLRNAQQTSSGKIIVRH